ncbi:phosphotransferase family protein [Actinophytocola sediminis]
MRANLSEPTETGLATLTGPDAADLLAAVLSPVGGRVEHWRIGQVDHQPGGRTTVGYQVRVAWPDGTLTEESLGAATGSLPAGAPRLTDGETEVAMWRFPFDPDLPALPAACDPDRMGRLATRLGLDGTAVTMTVRTYRPRRRAVVEVATPTGRVFVKVLRPAKVRAVHEAHRLAADAGYPAPRSLGWTDDGLLVLAELPGRTLRDVLLTGDPVDTAGVVDGVVTALDTLPTALATGRRRPTWGQKAAHYAEIVADTLPELAGRAMAIATAVDHAAPEGPAVPVHGDFYETQLMVAAGRVTGVLDIDTAGRGERLDDAACLLAHLAVLAQLHPGHAGAIDRLRVALHRRLTRDLDPAALARRGAAVVLSLATGPYRVREPGWRQATTQRVELAERLLVTTGEGDIG